MHLWPAVPLTGRVKPYKGLAHQTSRTELTPWGTRISYSLHQLHSCQTTRVFVTISQTTIRRASIYGRLLHHCEKITYDRFHRFRPLRITCTLLSVVILVVWHDDLEYERISYDDVKRIFHSTWTLRNIHCMQTHFDLMGTKSREREIHKVKWYF